jgi:ParB-like chromosome segregation protein Spo0J
MKIEQRKTQELIPYVNNARTHSDEQVAQIAASIKEFGWTNPILVDGTNGIIAGHGRLMAARKLGMDKVPVIELSHLSEAQKKALIIADNKLALNAEWDKELLSLEMIELKELNFDLHLLAFDESEFSVYQPNYDVLNGENVDEQIDGMASGVKKAIQIEFDPEDYEQAQEIVKFWRKQGAYVGKMILDYLIYQKKSI